MTPVAVSGAGDQPTPSTTLGGGGRPEPTPSRRSSQPPSTSQCTTPSPPLPWRSGGVGAAPGGTPATGPGKPTVTTCPPLEGIWPPGSGGVEGPASRGASRRPRPPSHAHQGRQARPGRYHHGKPMGPHGGTAPRPERIAIVFFACKVFEPWSATYFRTESAVVGLPRMPRRRRAWAGVRHRVVTPWGLGAATRWLSM